MKEQVFTKLTINFAEHHGGARLPEIEDELHSLGYDCTVSPAKPTAEEFVEWMFANSLIISQAIPLDTAYSEDFAKETLLKLFNERAS